MLYISQSLKLTFFISVWQLHVYFFFKILSTLMFKLLKDCLLKSLLTMNSGFFFKYRHTFDIYKLTAG